MSSNMSTKVALITGITGQDGSYLVELLLEKGYVVWGIVRRASDINTHRIDHLYKTNIDNRLVLKYGDLTDSTNLLKILSSIKENHPNMERLEVYNLAAMSHVKVSFEMPEYTGNVDGLGVLRILESIRATGLQDITRFYQASTSELYGKVVEIPQTEKTPFYPRSPYGVAKQYGYWITKNYRESYGIYACNGVLFNHESPRRGPTFVTRKITRGLGMILKGERKNIVLGNLDAKRDWGHAKDYVYAMWLMLQQDASDDYVIATGESYTVRQFVEMAFSLRGLNIIWKGTGIDEVGYDSKTGRELIKINPRYFRPAEVDILIGNSSKFRNKTGWKPTYSFKQLVIEMVDGDCC